MAKAVVLTFGKHRGRSVEELLLIDPDYLDWLRAQSDLLLKKPEIARAFTELGVSGDNTPVHNALQALFLDDAVCESLFRQLIGPNADQAIRDTVIAKRRKRILGAVMRSDAYSQRAGRRRSLLDEKLSRAKALRELDVALAGSDDDLKSARSAAMRASSPYPYYGLKALFVSDLDRIRDRAEQERRDLAESIVAARNDISKMRAQLVEARREMSLLKAGDVLVRFTVDERRMEERNGSDVRLKCSLSAKAPKAFDPSDRVDWTLEMWLEIKPYLSDDYPTLLRQMSTQRQLAKDMYSSCDRRFVAVIGRYGGHGATIEQVRQMFKASEFAVVLLEDMGQQMPKVSLPQAQSVGELPLFG